MKLVICAALVAAFAAGAAPAAQGELLEPLDQGVNAMLTAAGVPNRDATRVVPVVTSGGASAGYAQIIGPQAKVAATRAVVRISATTANGWTFETLVPVRSVNRSSGAMSREYGVAVDALVHGGE